MAYKVHQVILQSRPGKSNPPSEDNFAYVEGQPIDCKDGEIVAKTLYLSVDPYMRSRMNDPSGSSYIKPWPLNQPPSGGGVGVVVDSKRQGYDKGDIVQSNFPTLWPWQDYVAFSPEVQLQKVIECSRAKLLNKGAN